MSHDEERVFLVFYSFPRMSYRNCSYSFSVINNTRTGVCFLSNYLKYDKVFDRLIMVAVAV